jgi:hypothetical protein
MPLYSHLSDTKFSRACATLICTLHSSAAQDYVSKKNRPKSKYPLEISWKLSQQEKPAVASQLGIILLKYTRKVVGIMVFYIRYLFV